MTAAAALALLPLLEAATAATALRDIARVPQDWLAPPRDVLAEWPQGDFTPGKAETELLSIEGAGIVRSIAMEHPAGTLRFYFDGAKSPQWEVTAADLLDPKRGISPPALLTRTAFTGETLLPIVFAKGIRITAAENMPVRLAVAVDRVAEAETWWPFAPSSPAGLDEALRAATAPPPRGPLLHEWEIDLTPDASAWTFTAESDLAIGALEWESADEPESAERMRIRLPMGEGVEFGAALLFGRVQHGDPLNRRIVETGQLGGTWHLPFRMAKDATLVLRLRDGEAEPVRGTLRAYAAMGEAPERYARPLDMTTLALAGDGWAAGGFAVIDKGESYAAALRMESDGWGAAGRIAFPVEFAAPDSEGAPPPRVARVLAGGPGARLRVMGMTTAQRMFSDGVVLADRPILPGAAEWKAPDADLEGAVPLASQGAGKWRADPPRERRPQDRLVIGYTASGDVAAETVRAVARWNPVVAGVESMARFDDDVSPERGSDGVAAFYVPGRFSLLRGGVVAGRGDASRRTHGEKASSSSNPPHDVAILDVGANASWPGGPVEVEITLPDGAPVRIESVSLLRQDAPTTGPIAIQPLLYTGGWQQWQWPRHEARLTAKQLFRSARGIGFQLGFWSQQWLENVEAWPLGFRVADEARRRDPLVGADVLVAHAGEIELHHPSLKGATRIALRLGHGPRCGYVWVRDAAGNTLGATDQSMNRRVVLPRLVEFALPAPNPEGLITLAGDGRAPGSHGSQIVVESLLVLERQEAP